MPDSLPDAYITMPVAISMVVREQAPDAAEQIQLLAEKLGTVVSKDMVENFMLDLVAWGEYEDHPWYASSFLRSYWFQLEISHLYQAWSERVRQVFDQSVLIIAEALFGEDENWAAFRMALEARIDDSVQSNERRSR